MNLMCNCIAPAIPDWNWTPATDGIVDDEGFALVTVQATGHHSGGTLNFPTLPPVPASGKRFKLPPSLLKVKVEEGQIKEIVALKGDKSGLMALYDTLAGEGRGVSNASNSVTGSKKA